MRIAQLQCRGLGGLHRRHSYQEARQQQAQADPRAQGATNGEAQNQLHGGNDGAAKGGGGRHGARKVGAYAHCDMRSCVRQHRTRARAGEVLTPEKGMSNRRGTCA
ncbi:hypothetical protein GCM10023090_14660 [Acidovorax lacteus]|uniref:Uncharacterized protein n=1 Tax=Acidovorax lacteus TaxID=1924988 RepID=A0ABP8L692_9BURK